MSVLLILGEPSIDVASDGADGIILVLRCHNHPVDGTRLHFDRSTAKLFLNTFHSRLTNPGKSELFPGQVQAHIIREANRVRLILDAWKRPAAHPDEPPPELAFPLDAAQKLYREMAKVTGHVAVVV